MMVSAHQQDKHARPAHHPRQEPSPPMTRNSSMQMDSVLPITRPKEQARPFDAVSSRPLSQRLVRSKSKMKTRVLSLRYQMFPTSEKKLVKTSWGILIQSSRPKPKGPRSKPEAWSPPLCWFRDDAFDNKQAGILGEAVALVRRSSVRALERVRSMNALGTFEARRSAGPKRHSAWNPIKSQKQGKKHDKEVSEALADLLFLAERSSGSMTAQEKLDTLTIKIREILCLDEGTDDRLSLSDTPPRFSRQASQDMTLLEGEPFLDQVADDLRRVEQKAGVMRRLREAPTPPLH
ncbi:MAG: hypothetical protein SGCHY_001048 [Lobulomycetales sp.]